MPKKKQSDLVILDENNYYRNLPRHEKTVFREYACRKMQMVDVVFRRKIAGTVKVTPAEAFYYKTLVEHYEDVRKDRILQLS